MFQKLDDRITYSGDPDQTAAQEKSDSGLHFLRSMSQYLFQNAVLLHVEIRLPIAFIFLAPLS